jgi:hypothetical protein
MIAEELNSHICTPTPTDDSKTIEVDYYIEIKDEHNRTVIVSRVWMVSCIH